MIEFIGMNTRSRLAAQQRKTSVGIKVIAALISAGLLSGCPVIPFAISLLAVVGEPAKAQTIDPVSRIAEAITVRIEGATHGSGVLVKREGSTYSVLTAWHVVEAQRAGEELSVFTSDGIEHSVHLSGVRRIEGADMAVLVFDAKQNYKLATVDRSAGLHVGEKLFISGYATGSPSLFRFESARLAARATAGISDGYQLVYIGSTFSGMSGGPVLRSDGIFIGIHGRAEVYDERDSSEIESIKTGISMGMPIEYYLEPPGYSRTQNTAPQLKTYDDYIAQARLLLDIPGREREVARLASTALVMSRSRDALILRAKANMVLFNWDDVINDLTAAIDAYPGNAWDWKNRAYAKSRIGDTNGAMSDYASAIAIEPSDAEGWNIRGMARLHSGDKKNAIIDFTKALELNGSDAGIWLNRGLARMRSGDSKGAIADLSQAIRLRPKYASAYMNRGIARSQRGDRKGALEDYSNAITINPRLASAWYNRGNEKAEAGDNSGAILDYSEAISINDKDPDFWFNRGYSRDELGDKRGAIADYSRAIILNPLDPGAWLRRGIAYLSIDDRPSAISDFGKVLDIYPQYGQAWAARGTARLELGDFRGGCSDLRKAVSLGHRVRITRAVATGCGM